MDLAIPKRSFWKAYTVVGRVGSQTGTWIEQSGMQCDLLARASAQPHLDVVSNFLQLKFQEVGSSSSKNRGVWHSFSLGIPFSTKQCPAEGKAALQQDRIPPKAQQGQQVLPVCSLSWRVFSNQLPSFPHSVSNLIQVSFIPLHKVIQNRADLFYDFSPLHHHLPFSPQINRNQEPPWYQRGKAAPATHIWLRVPVLSLS